MVTRVAEGMLRDVRVSIGHLMPATPSPDRWLHLAKELVARRVRFS